MSNNPDRQLFELFQSARKPVLDELFADRVTERIKQHKTNHRKWLIVSAIIGFILIVFLNSWFAATTHIISVITNLIAQNIWIWMFTPFGYIIGGLMALLLFVKLRG